MIKTNKAGQHWRQLSYHNLIISYNLMRFNFDNSYLYTCIKLILI